MPALVTTPPIQITPTFQRSNFFSINPFIWNVGSAIYQVLDVNVGFTISIVKSTDNGNTWATLDAANEISPDGALLGATFNPSTGIIYFAFPSTGLDTHIKIASFNTNSDLYGPVSAQSPALIIPDDSAPVIYQKSDGTLVVLYASTSNPGPLSYISLPSISGSWTSETPIGALTMSYATGVVVDASDNAHLVYVPDITTGDLNYVLIDPSFTPGSPITLDTGYDQIETDQRIWNNKIAIAWTGGSSGNDNTLKVAIGTPLSGPTFTTYTVNTVATTGFMNWVALAVNTIGALVVFSVWLDLTTDPIIDQLLMWTFDGVSSWGSPLLFYDEVTNPPANSVPQPGQYIHAIGAANQLANGTWVVSIALEVYVTPPTGETCGGYVLVTPGNGPPTPACPLSGTAVLGEPYTGMLTASGGTPPYTWSIIE